MFKLETRFVDNRLVDNSGLGQLNIVFRALIVVFAAGQRKTTDTSRATGFRIAIATHQGVGTVDLIIDSRTERRATIGDRHAFIETHDMEIGIENCRNNKRLIIDITLLKVDKERRFLLGDRTTKVSAVLS